MKNLILASALIAAAGLGNVAVAQPPAAIANTQQSTVSDVAIGAKQVPAPGSRNCVRETGSHIRRHDQACLSVNGQSFSHDELQRTGQPDIGRALQRLDPRVQISGH